MATVETVRGPVDSGSLGATLMHEHVFVLSSEIMQNYPEDWGDEERRDPDEMPPPRVAERRALARAAALRLRTRDRRRHARRRDGGGSQLGRCLAHRMVSSDEVRRKDTAEEIGESWRAAKVRRGIDISANDRQNTKDDQCTAHREPTLGSHMQLLRSEERQQNHPEGVERREHGAGHARHPEPDVTVRTSPRLP